MRLLLRWPVVMALAVGVGVGTFLASRGSGQPTAAGRQPVAQWLDLDADQAQRVAQADPQFPSDSARLADALAEQRAALAGMLEDATASDEAIMAQVEQVIDAHDALERRVARHVLTIRPHLSLEQQKRMMGLLAEEVRQNRHRWRGGRDASPTGGDRDDADNSPGRRWRGGRGRGSDGQTGGETSGRTDDGDGGPRGGAGQQP